MQNDVLCEVLSTFESITRTVHSQVKDVGWQAEQGDPGDDREGSEKDQGRTLGTDTQAKIGHGIQLSVNSTLFRGPDGELMTPASFTNASKPRHAFIFPPIDPEGHQKFFSFPEQRWHSWWKALRKIRRVHSDAEDTAHLLSQGSLHPGAQLWSATHSELNNRSASCVMCLSDALESLVHLAIGGPLARRLWAAVSPSLHPVFGDFVCPLASCTGHRIVELRLAFFHSIWKLSRRRRFSSQPLKPITETEFEELRGSIQGCTGRLASL
ncbi:BQ2448_2004 [Microbotryum intermedium]|uniref:BQ2448_2004 protein n=1 Tax=Microbotryum intermedium TaxID=269621 RepID=A0A238FAR8_9BASI|nr:BQ2448_2004 [Microbotryum intermedium]